MSRLWRDAAYRAWLYQAAVVIGCLWLVYAGLLNALNNLRARGISPGFGFLTTEAGIPIADAPPVPEQWRYIFVFLGLGTALMLSRKCISLLPLTPLLKTIGTWCSAILILALMIAIAATISWHRYEPTESFATLVVTGMMNNIRIGLVACFLAIILGFILGICLRSTNWLLRNIVGVATEIIRNVPLLLHIMFWYTSIITFFPPVRRSWVVGDLFFFTQRGIFFPAIADFDVQRLAVFGAIGPLVLLALFYKRMERLGLVLISLALAVVTIGVASTWDVPKLRGLNFSGGAFLSPEYAALLIGLVVYVSAFIADIVRSGINAIPKGQWEAAFAVGLSRLQVTRHVIVPQALRVILPPMANQILGLAKNTSLGVAIAYPELVAITRTVVNQTGHALEMMAIVFAFFLTINLIITSIFNYLNHRLRIIER